MHARKDAQPPGSLEGFVLARAGAVERGERLARGLGEEAHTATWHCQQGFVSKGRASGGGERCALELAAEGW